MSVTKWYENGTSVSINELNVFFRREGSGEPLLCIHGFPSSSWDYQPIWKELTEHFDVIASDLIGLGKSAKPKRPITIAMQADIIEQLLAEQGISSAHILAHDLGDTVAQELLARQKDGSCPVRWLSCTFLNGGIFPETHHALFIQKLLISPLGGLAVHLMSEKSFRKSMIRVFSQAHPPSEEFLKETWKLIEQDNGKLMIPRLIRYMRERVDHRERWVSPLSEGIVPLHLINGVEDPISGEHAADRFATLVPSGKITRIQNSGHYPHVETPEEVLEAFLRFHNEIVS